MIEIDESLFGKKRKFNVGSGQQDQWVFGIVKKGQERLFLGSFATGPKELYCQLFKKM